jgi:hypothetical protein
MHAPTAPAASPPQYRTSGDSLARAILAGFAASLTMLLMFLVAYNLARLLSAAPIPTWPALERTSIIHPATWVTGEGHADLAHGDAAYLTDVLETPRLWLINLTHNRLIDAGLADVYLAAGIYLAGGLFWAVVYTLVEFRLGGSPRVRGVTFAMLPALVSLAVVLPVLGGGPFGLALGAGPLPTIGNLVLHAVYGSILGVVYGPFGDLDSSTLERPDLPVGGAARGPYERTAALVLLGGLLLGGLVGLAASIVTGSDAGLTLLGQSSSGLILWGALLGAAIGLLIGSFLGLGQGQPRRRER